MNERTSRKIPVTERQFLWVQDDDKGEVTLHVGPTMVSPTAADRIVIDDGLGGFREDNTGRPQMMVELGDNQYAVLFNPLQENDGGPNGRFKQGRNESRPLKNGTRSMIPGPCAFWLRPGQRADVRDAHELASNQYLVVKVYGAVDKTAPFYEVTARSAAITRATAENVTDGGKATRVDQNEPVDLRRGQLIVIRGLDTQFYIPPTGVDIVPDTSVDASGATLTASAARQLLSQLPPLPAPEAAVAAGPAQQQEVPSEVLAELAAEEEPADDQLERKKGAPRPGLARDVVDQSARSRGRVAPAPAAKVAMPATYAQANVAFGPPGGASAMAPPPPPPPAPQQNLADLAGNVAFRRALEKEARQARLIRNAVVLGEKEYCVIVDADGKREIKVGPARVFPGPYDTFMTEGSRLRVYDAYELLPQRALWLRVIAPISKAALAAKLPRGFALEKEGYYPGDELLLAGVSTFFVPFNEIEVLSPQTGEAVVGNDHSRVFIEAIGIDQKSGIYVRDLATGEVRLVRGKQSYLVDPRKEVHITRTIPAEQWNLWVSANEPHKGTQGAITTPWAVSVIVPHNTAVLATSANGQRVIEGPCVTLLEYEETLTPVLLSTGTPKSDESPLQTCFLRTVGNRVSDEIAVETADYVKISLRVSYSVTFVPEQKARWFNHENYIQIMVDHLRSIVRGRCRTLSLSQLWPQVPAIVRDTILGEKGEKGARPGRVFSDNGTVVTEVEVLSSVIEDEAIAGLMLHAQTEAVTLQIGDRQAQETLNSARLRAEIARAQQELEVGAKERAAKLAELQRRLAHEAALAVAREREVVAAEAQRLADLREAAAQKARAEREAASKQAELLLLQHEAAARAESNRKLAAASLEEQTALRQLEVLLINAQSAATVAERNAVQRGLVEAMTALGDKIMLAEVAENMNLVSLFKGKDVGQILADVLGGTKVMPTVKALVEKYGAKAGDGAPAPGAKG